MFARCPAMVGQPLSAVDTPALVLELDAYERNLERMASLIGAAELRFRPHAKTHKSPLIALDQVARGAVGVCCQTVGVAEILAQGGVRDILIANQVVGKSKIARLAELARWAKMSVCVDNANNISDLAVAAEASGTAIEILVEIDVGGERCGVAAGNRLVSWPNKSLRRAIYALVGCRPITAALSKYATTASGATPSAAPPQ